MHKLFYTGPQLDLLQEQYAKLHRIDHEVPFRAVATRHGTASGRANCGGSARAAAHTMRQIGEPQRSRYAARADGGSSRNTACAGRPSSRNAAGCD
jgi:hypothetical protein